jgi:hypothetical protein
LTNPLIVLIEDSERYISELLGLIDKQLKIQADRVQVIRTEVEFYRCLPELAATPPAIFIVDIMVPYKAVGDTDDFVPADIRRKAADHKFYRAGIRCTNSLLNTASLVQIPVILHSILEKEDLESDNDYPIPNASNVTLCKKEANGHGIIQAARQVLDLDR